MKQYPKEKEVVQDAWRVANDSLRTDACLLYAPHQIAIACLMTAVTINKREEEFKKYFQELNTDYDEIFEIVKMILHSYKLHISVYEKEENIPYIKSLFAKMPKPQAISSGLSQTMMEMSDNGLWNR